MDTPRRLGATGLTVPPLGLGAGQLGDDRLEEAEAGRLLNSALDLGVTFVDTARGYGRSEERIGRHLAHRRAEFVLAPRSATAWTARPTGPPAACVAASTRRSRRATGRSSARSTCATSGGSTRGFAPGVSCCIVGTSRLEHLRRNVELAARGPLPADVVEAARAAFRANDRGWEGQV